MNESLLNACKADDPSQIAAAMLQSEFWLVNVSEPGQSDTSALVIEVEGFPALVGFTSQDHAGTFASAVDKWLDEDGELPCFVVDGKEFLENLPKKFGIAINPETEHYHLFTPDFARKLKKK